MCEFESFAKDIVKSIASYEQFIVFSAILQEEVEGNLSYIFVDDICKRTNIHTRDVMRHLNILVKHKFVDTCSRLVDKRRTVAYGIDYAAMMNFVYSMFVKIQTTLQTKYDFHCASCNKNYTISDCMNMYTLEVACPCNFTHDMTECKKNDNELDKIQQLMTRLQSLKGKHPRRIFKDITYVKRASPDDDVDNARVVSRKSSIS